MDLPERMRFSVCSPVLRITVAFPLSVGRTVGSVFFFRFLNATLSAFVRLSMGSIQLTLLTVLVIQILNFDVANSNLVVGIATYVKKIPVRAAQNG
jgi:hypothetical protein